MINNLNQILQWLSGSYIIHTLIIIICLDTVLGFISSAMSKSISTSISIKGLLRKFAMIIIAISLYFIDCLININFIGFIPSDITPQMNITDIGLSEFFSIIFILFEIISIIKNMGDIGLPFPPKLKEWIEKVFNNWLGGTSNNQNNSCNYRGLGKCQAKKR